MSAHLPDGPEYHTPPSNPLPVLPGCAVPGCGQEECATVHMISDGHDFRAPGPRCPECLQGKHVNCTGDAWDFEADEPTSCTCLSH